MSIPSSKKYHKFGMPVLAILSILFLSWNTTYHNAPEQFWQIADTDTIPAKKHTEPRNLDELILELDQLDIEKEVKEALAATQDALKELNFSKLQAEINKELASLNTEAISQQLKMELTQKQMEELNTELKKIKELDLTEVKQSMEKARKELDNLQPMLKEKMKEAKLEMEKAKVEMQKAKDQLQRHKKLVAGLEEEGLLDSKKPYTLEHKDGKLYLNEKPVSEDIYNKYKSLLEEDKNFKIQQQSNSISII